jgi:Kef-type K+ transport system membrane component KefB
VGATQLDLTLLLGAVVLLAAIVAVRFATRIGLPGLLVYLAIGLALQSIVHFDDARRAQSLGLAALVLILAEGGLTTRWDDVKPAVVPAALLSTLGVAISMSVTALIANAACEPSAAAANSQPGTETAACNSELLAPVLCGCQLVHAQVGVHVLAVSRIPAERDGVERGRRPLRSGSRC